MKVGRLVRNSQGTLAMGRTSPPEDGRPTPPTPWELRCLDSFSPEKRRLADSLETHRGPWPWVGHHPLKTAGPHPQAPGSCAAPKSVPLHGGLRCRDWISTEKRRLADPLETHRGPWPWVGHHPLKTAGPHPQPPGSCAASTHFPLKNEGWPIRSKLTGDLGHG